MSGRHGVIACALFFCIDACGGDESPPDEGVETKAANETPVDVAPPPARGDEARHRVVFGDRTSQAYLLLLATPRPPALPSREQLVQLVQHAFVGAEDREEVGLLIELIRTESQAIAPAAPLADDDPGAVQVVADPKQDLLGLHIAVVPVDGELIPPAALQDEILLRELDSDERASLSTRQWAILLRADYRNMHGVRGLRLLQTLVRILAEHDDALIHDPDTAETLDARAFERRRLQANLGNIADQLAVVPFSDPGHEGRVRLTTRGMRRFGSVDLELDALPRDPWVLQRATDLLCGLALVMVKEGEFHASGFAVELDDTVPIHWRDASRAYAGRVGSLPRCDACPEQVLVHLVEREHQPQDAQGHVVARVVAPRPTSDAPGYDHARWVEESIGRLFGDHAPE